PLWRRPRWASSGGCEYKPTCRSGLTRYSRPPATCPTRSGPNSPSRNYSELPSRTDSSTASTTPSCGNCGGRCDGDALAAFREVWLVACEFTSCEGCRPVPLCVVAREYRTGRLVRVWLGDGAPAVPPYPTGPDVLFVAYYASAELGSHLALGWPVPAR